jgi:hypothetical protein
LDIPGSVAPQQKHNNDRRADDSGDDRDDVQGGDHYS